jgi:Na+/proline symporter
MIVVATVVCVLLALYFQSIVSAWIFISSLLTAAVLIPLMAGLFSPRPLKRAAGLASSLAGLVTAVAFYLAVNVLGTYDTEWETVIWEVSFRGGVVQVWQEYALLLALPVSAVAFVAGQLLGRSNGGGPVSARAATAARDHRETGAV